MPRLALLIALLALGLGAAAHLLWPGERAPASLADGGAAVAAALQGLGDEPDGAGSGVVPERPLRFPADHGPHPASPGELWDLSGVVRDEQGRRYGLRLTFVHVRLSDRQRPSRLAAAAVVAARLAVAVEDTEQARSQQRVSRAALGLAGAALVPAPETAARERPAAAPPGQGDRTPADSDAPDRGTARVWVGDWRLERELGGGLRVTAMSESIALSLTLAPAKAPVAIDDADLMGAPRDAERVLRLYLQPRLAAAGTLTLDGEQKAVSGDAWLDHAWGGLAGLAGGGPGRLAVNRFELQLDDNTELACVQLRRRSGGGTPIPTCVSIAADGGTRVYRRRDLTLEPEASDWIAADGTAYPLHWRLDLPALELQLRIRPLVRDQQDDLILPLWSGVVLIEGTRAGAAIAGQGRVDLSGYAPAAPAGT